MAQQPAHHNMGFVLCAFTVINRVALLHPQGCKHTLLVTDRQFDIQAIKPLERQFLELLMVLPGWNVAVGGKNGVARVVMVFVKLHQVIVGQINNMIRLTATVVVVGGGREQVAGQVLPQLGGRRTHGPFHLVVDHASVYQVAARVIRFVEFQAVAFLGKIQRVQLGEKHRIQVHRQQVVKVLAVHAGKRIGGPVAAGEGVHKGVQRTPDHHEKRISDRITFATTQRRVLKNMSHPGGIHREGAQRHEEDVLVVVRRQMKVAGAGFLMAIFLNLKVQRVDPVTAKFLEGRVNCVIGRCSH